MTAVLERPPAEWVGSTTPRLWTRPLVTGPPGPCGCGCALTPETSLGFEVVEFANELDVKLLGGKPGDPVLLPWQRWFLIHLLELRSDGLFRFKTALLLVSRQNGKALDTATPVLTTAGWSTMGELQVGDEVFHPDGHPTRVVGAYDVQHGRRCYEVTTTDGRRVVADAEHLWTVQDRRRPTTKGRAAGPNTRTYRWETLTTEELLGRGITRQDCVKSDGRRHRDYAYRLPAQAAVLSKPVDLPIDPYLFGVWLGDGASRDPEITVSDRDLEEMGSLIEETGARVISARRGRTAWQLRLRLGVDDRLRGESRLLTALRDLDVLRNKHVPDLYLTAGTEQRLALLQGLMDTDGYIDPKRGQAEFVSVRRELAEAVLYLVRSLGWRATIREAAATLNGREVSRKWRVLWTPTRSEGVPFRLRRKAERVRDGQGDRSAVSIASIEAVESRPVRCIKVDREDGLFLAGRDLMPTHNTRAVIVLALYMVLIKARFVGSAAQNLTIAGEAWELGVELLEADEEFSAEIRLASRRYGSQKLVLTNRGRWQVAAATRKGARGLSGVDLLLVDELREQTTWEGWAALDGTTTARDHAMTIGLSNAGDDQSVVLNTLTKQAHAGADDTIGAFEWSGSPGCELGDREEWAQANPGLGHSISVRTLASKLATLPPNQFRAEHLCQTVDALDAALDTASWKACSDPTAAGLAGLGARVAVCLVVTDSQEVVLVGGAPLSDGRVHVQVGAHWSSTDQARAALSDTLARIAPAVIGWWPSGPGSVLAPELRPIEGAVELVGAKAVEACMGLADLVASRKVLHLGDEALNLVMARAKRKKAGEGWRFAEWTTAYAVAGATYLARTAMPPPEPPLPRPRIY